VTTEQFPALIVVTPLMMSCIVFAAGWFIPNICFPLVICTLSACLFFAAGLVADVINSGSPLHYCMGAWPPPWGIEYVVDHLNVLILLAIAVIALLSAIYSRSMAAREFPQAKLPQFYALYLLQVTGLFGITITGDVFNLYVLLEIASFSAYAMIGMGERGAAFAAFRYMIFGTIGAGAYLLGVGYLYILTGSLNMADLNRLLPSLYQSKPLLAGFSLILVGIAIKMALFPVHTWLPDSYTLAPSSVSALLAPLFTKVSAYVLIRVLLSVFNAPFYTSLYPTASVLGWIAAAGVMFAAFLAVAQSDLKRMLCYLIVCEIGYIVIGISSSNRLGLTGALLHLVNDMFMMACLFAASGIMCAHARTRNIYELRDLHRTLPLTMAVFVFGALSVIGVPPLCGFFSKWYLVLGAIQAQQWPFVCVILMSSLLNTVLFFRIIEQVYFPPREAIPAGQARLVRPAGLDPVPLGELIPASCLACCLLLLGLLSNVLITRFISRAIPGSF
jgi:multicomponent Na+:H+ antiporter subunit D